MNVTDVPAQIVVEPAAIETLAGMFGLTVTAVAELVAEHPLAFVTVTVYEPDAFAVIEDVVAPLLHKYEFPTLAVNITFPPSQNVVEELALIVAVGAVVF